METTVRELERWAKPRDERFDPGDVRIMLEIAEETLGLGAAGALTPGGLATLMAEFRRVVDLGVDEVPEVFAAARALVDFLTETGAVPPEGAERLREELIRVEPEFTASVARTDDPERQRYAAELLVGLMRDDGVDPADEDAVRRWAEEFNELSDEEQLGRVSEHAARLENEATVVRPVRLAPRAELAARARASGLTEAVTALAGWVGERELTEAGGLSAEDAAAAAGALGLGALPPGVAEPADRRELEELDRLWRSAVSAGALSVADGRVRPGPALDGLEHGDDQAVLAGWLAAFEAAVTLEVEETDEVERERNLNPFEVVRKDLPGVLIHLYDEPEPVAPEELFAALFDHIEESYEFSDRALLELASRYALDLEMFQLARWGVVETGEGEATTLTPLGIWGVRELLLADGHTAPLVGDLAAAPAAEFLNGLNLHGEDTAEEEIGLWLDGRDPAGAAAELVGVMRDGTPGVRNLAAAVLHRAGPAAEAVVRGALDHPCVRPYAALWLHAHGDDAVEPSPDEMMWIFTDTLAGLLETADPEEALAAALADAPAGADLGAMVAELWRVDHPDVAPVLDVLGRHHPDRAVAKIARKSAFKARSRS